MPVIETSSTARHTDPELLGLRLDVVQDEVLPHVIERAQGLNPWQNESLAALQQGLQPDQTIDLPTRSGKSYLLRKIAQAATDLGVRTAIVTHRRHIINEHTEELLAQGIPTQDIGQPQVEQPGVLMVSAQTIAVQKTLGEALDDTVDLVLIDEGHRALGEETVAGMREVFPNAVRILFTATPDYADDRSVTDEYGDKLVSHGVVEAIREGRVSPVRAFLYKTEAVIDNLDPYVGDFTPRELRRLSTFLARNKAIVDIAEDLVTDGRQGLITTIPGEDLLHADTLQKLLDVREITDSDGRRRRIRSHVVRGGDLDIAERLQDFEDGAIDILLYCDLLREGYSTDVTSFLINGRPTTSIVNLTQDIGRTLQLKDREAVIVDFKDNSVKQQRTVYDVLELERSVQGVLVGKSAAKDKPEPTGGDSYMRGLFRPELVHRFKQYNNRLVAELSYSPETPQTPFQKKREAFERERISELATQTRIWERVLAKEGLLPEPGPDNFGLSAGMLSGKKATVHANASVTVDILPKPRASYYPWRARTREDNFWPGIEHEPITVPVIPMDPVELAHMHPNPRVVEHFADPQDIATVTRTSQLHTVIMSALNEFSRPQEKDTIIQRFGLDSGRQPRTLEEVGEYLGVTRERVRQIESRALAILRHPWRLSGVPLKELLHDTDVVEDDYTDQAIHQHDIDAAQQASGSRRFEKKVQIFTDEEIARNKEAMRQRDLYFENLKNYLVTGDFYSGVSVFEALLERRNQRMDFAAYNDLLKELDQVQPGVLLEAATSIKEQREQYFRSTSARYWPEGKDAVFHKARELNELLEAARAAKRRTELAQ